MSDRINDLLLATLRRGNRPMSSDDLLDTAVGEAQANGWSTADTARLNRRSIAVRLQGMEDKGLIKLDGGKLDTGARRMTPCYVPVDGFDPKATMPPPPRRTQSTGDDAPANYRGLSQSQLLTVMDVQDALIECVQRFLVDLSTTREKARKRLASAGLGTHG